MTITAAAALVALALVAPVRAAGQEIAAGQPVSDDPLGPPPLYTQLREASLESAGRIRDGRLTIDRFAFTFTDGHLFLLEPTGGVVTGAVFLGRGTVRSYPPDAVEHQQLKKHLDKDFLEEEFDRLVFRFTGDISERLRALTDGSGTGGDRDKAADLFKNRREDLFKDQLANADSRVLVDLIERRADAAPYVLALVDGRKRGWFTIEIEPRDLEEVSVSRYDEGHEMTDVWMSFHAQHDFDASTSPDPLAGFAIDPTSLDKKAADVTGADLGLPVRPREPSMERWSPLADVPVVTADVALDDDGKTQGTAVLLVDPLSAMSTLRLWISPFLQVTDVRWRRPDPDGRLDADTTGAAVDLLAGRPGADKPSNPTPVAGERLHVVQERRSRFMADDLFEPWVTIVLPQRVEAGERFIVEVAYSGKVVEKIPSSLDFLLRDTLSWIPGHRDSRRSRFHLTFRVPKRYGVASPGEIVDDRIEGDVHIVRRVTPLPMRHVSFHYARFDVTEVALDDLPPITVFANADSPGFAPGQRQKTIDDLAGAIRTQAEYFGAYPFPSLQVTETPTLSGQAFGGFLLLSYRSFGELHSGESELFRSHEVAHQWWGAGVDWLDYRDQWISEGFAQYAAALYALTGLGHEQAFGDMLEAWRRDILGDVSLRAGQGRAQYGMTPGVIRKSDGSKSGALVAGSRLRSTSTPYDYRLLVYEKGAFILHMLRSMLLEPGDDDSRFRELMRTFAARYMYGVANTRDFEAVVSEVFGQPMGWFFDQWVYGVEIPTYRSDLKVSALVDSDAPFVLHGTITQEDVSDAFRMPVPILLRFTDREPLVHRVWIEGRQVEVELPLPARPSEIEFNYQDAVLARVR